MAVRFSDSLRAFAGVCKNGFSEEGLKVNLVRPPVSKWNMLKDFVSKRTQQTSSSRAVQMINDMRPAIISCLKDTSLSSDDSSLADMFVIVVRVLADGEKLEAKVASVHIDRISKLLGFAPPKDQLNNLAFSMLELLRVLDKASIKLIASGEFASVSSRTQFGKTLKFVGLEDGEAAEAELDGPLFSDEDDARPALVDSLLNFTDLSKLHGEAQKAAARKEQVMLSVDYIISNSSLSEAVARDLFDSLMAVLRSSETDAAIQGQLVDLVGFENVELVAKLIENRAAGVQRGPGGEQLQVRSQAERGRNRARKKQRRTDAESGSESDEERVVQLGMNEYIEREQRDAQQRATARAKASANAAEGWHPRVALDATDWGAPSLTEAERVALASGNVYDQALIVRNSAAYVGTAKLALPEGVVRRTMEEFEEITLPAPVRTGEGPLPSERLVPTSRMDDLGRRVFAGIERLNAIQSVVFEAAYGTNENLLVCAPTGAGKTNVALLTIVRELKQHIAGNRLRTEDFKMVYVAPMKALATEMTTNFSRRLAPVGVTVAELTGDTQLSRAQMDATQLFVTTPEKWDVLTRKSVGDSALSLLVRLLIIDEVHLLADERGAVLEALVARTLRQVESNQRMIRLVGLSATLPNYVDVARFLRVNPARGLFYFDSRFRPVPLTQSFVGIKARSKLEQTAQLNRVCYQKVLEQVREGHQVLVFVHARNETVRTAMVLREFAMQQNHIRYFTPYRFKRRHGKNGQKADEDEDNEAYEEIGLDRNEYERMPEEVRRLIEQDPGEQERLARAREFGRADAVMSRSNNKELRQLFRDGFAVHHRGVERRDRQLVERYFSQGLIRCLVCTSTLAWGVNLPAHAVVIKGTQFYDASRSSFVDLGLLDVLQIFGRAGRPQFDTSGIGIILTTHDRLALYLRVLTQQSPIESRFAERLPDHLNAEVVLGTVSSLQDAVRWLSYTYLFVRARRNPAHYGVENADDLSGYCRSLVLQASQVLDRARMVRFNEVTQMLASTDRGRIASHLYVQTETIETFNARLASGLLDADVMALLCAASEFSQVKVRDDELGELDELAAEHCRLGVRGGLENESGKVSVLLQTYVAGALPDSFSLVSDQAFVAQNAARLARALFELALHRGWAALTERLLRLAKTIEQRLPLGATPLRQLETAGLPPLGSLVYDKIERAQLSVERLRELDRSELGALIRHASKAAEVKLYAHALPALEVSATVQPITRTVLRMTVLFTADFEWHERAHAHGAGEPFWLLVEDPDSDTIHHYEQLNISRRHVHSREQQTCTFAIPVEEPLPAQYLVRFVSDRWLGSESTTTVSFKRLVLPLAAAGRLRAQAHTELLDLRPLPITALRNSQLEAVYASRFAHFNAVQTQTFHTLYYTDSNVLLGAPTGSGKTVAAELAIFRVLQTQPNSTCVYIAPLKALVRERVADWRARLPFVRVVELSGDVAPDVRAVERAQLIVTTPEKWDGVSRGWRQRAFVRRVRLIVLDEIHLLGEDRGPVLEVIVSRANYIVAHTHAPIRLVGLSTALANAVDLADWLGVPVGALFNFRPAVRPVPLDVHISAFPGKHYCPRMATMNRPAFNAILTHSPEKPTLIFVSSRRQTRLTALDLIAYLGSQDNPKRFLNVDEQQLELMLRDVRDANLRLTLAFGIGLHHAGLHETDRVVVERMFVTQQIGVLVATSTLAWGVNFPAHLVIVKGTEYFDGKTCRYVDYPITDVLQMMGRAGRPQFDDHGVACIFVHDVKKDFYKKFLYEPFPVESSLLGVLHDHLNAEIVGGTICTKQDALLYLHHTYLMRRLVANPSYYELDSLDNADAINVYLNDLIEKTLKDLVDAENVEVAEDGRTLSALTYGRTAAYYYVQYRTAKLFGDALQTELELADLLTLLADAHEFDFLPVRHNEDLINTQMVERSPLTIDALRSRPPDDSHLKTLLLFAAHFARDQMPISDYGTDLKTVLDQSVRLLQCAIDLSAEHGSLINTIRLITLSQMLVQACWPHDDPVIVQLPPLGVSQVFSLASFVASLSSSVPQSAPQHDRSITLPELLEAYVRWPAQITTFLDVEMHLNNSQVNRVCDALSRLPIIGVEANILACQAERDSQPICVDLLANCDPLIPESGWIRVKRDSDYALNVSLTRMSAVNRQKVLAPRFPKAKTEMWYLLLGAVEQRELLALRRVHEIGRALGGKTKPTPLVFHTPESEGRYVYCVYLLSDSYRGLDQQYTFRLIVEK